MDFNKAAESLGFKKGDTITRDLLKQQYRKKALEHHPDRNSGNKQAEEMFKIVANANEALLNLFDVIERGGKKEWTVGSGSNGSGTGSFNNMTEEEIKRRREKRAADAEKEANTRRQQEEHAANQRKKEQQEAAEERTRRQAEYDRKEAEFKQKLDDLAEKKRKKQAEYKQANTRREKQKLEEELEDLSIDEEFLHYEKSHHRSSYQSDGWESISEEEARRKGGAFYQFRYQAKKQRESRSSAWNETKDGRKYQQREKKKAWFKTTYGSDYEDWFDIREQNDAAYEEVRQAYARWRQNPHAPDDEDRRRAEEMRAAEEEYLRKKEELRRKYEEMMRQKEEKQAEKDAYDNNPEHKLQFVVLILLLAILSGVFWKNRDMIGFETSKTLAIKELEKMRADSAQAVMDSLRLIQYEEQNKREQEAQKFIQSLIHIKDYIAALDSRGIYKFLRIKELQPQFERFGDFQGGGVASITGRSGKVYDFSFVVCDESYKIDDGIETVRHYIYVIDNRSTLVFSIVSDGRKTWRFLDGPQVSDKIIRDIEGGMYTMLVK